MPLEYWPHACSTAVYLINRLPTPTLNNESPYSKVFGTQPNYTKLRSFSCLCYPWLKPYTTHKLDLKSKPCVFIAYSPTQSAYYCLELDSHKIYTSRHVHFVEHIFPFSEKTNTSLPLPTLLDEWAPLTLATLIPPTQLSPSSLTPIISTTSSTPTPSLNPTPLFSAANPDHTTTPPSSPITPVSLTPCTTPTPPHTNRIASNPSSPHPTHKMSTRLQHGIRKPINKLNLNAESVTVDVPKNITQALKSPVWRKAMDEEINALVKNQTWNLVPPDTSQNVVGCKWIFRIKKDKDGNIIQYKARYVARGFNQRPGINYGETFSPVVKPATIRLILSLAVCQGWPLCQLDINNAFLQGTLTDDVYTIQPPGYCDPKHPTYVCN